MKRLTSTLAILATALAAHAAQITGTGDPLSNPALIGGIQENFDTTAAGDYTSLTFGNFTLTGLNAAFTIGSDFNGNYNTTGGQSVLTGFDNMPSAYRFSFANPVSAFAFNWGAADTTWTLNTYNSVGGLLESLIVPPTFGSNNLEYFGATGPISYADLTSDGGPGSDYVFIDRVTYSAGATASAPDGGTTAVLVGLGLAAMAVVRRRQKA